MAVSSISQDTPYNYQIKSYNQYGSSAKESATGSTLPRWTIVEIPDIFGWGTLTRMFHLDADDNPHTLRMRTDNGDLVHTYFDGSTWQSSVIANEFIWTLWSNLSADSVGNLHVAYLNETASAVLYRKKTGNTWGSVQVVDNAPGVNDAFKGSVSIAVDGSDKPHISYHDHANRALRHGRLTTSGSWQTYVVHPPQWGMDRYGYNSEIAVTDNTGYILYSHYRTTDPDDSLSFRIAVLSDLYNSNHTTHSVHGYVFNDPPSLGTDLSITIDGNGKPYGLFPHLDTGGLVSVRRPLNTWLYSDVGTPGHDVSQFSVSVGNDNVARVVYRNVSQNTLVYAYWSGTAWIRETIPVTPGTLLKAEIAVDSANNPHFVYNRHPEYDFTWVRRNPD